MDDRIEIAKRAYQNATMLYLVMVMAVVMYVAIAYILFGSHSRLVDYRDSLVHLRTILLVFSVMSIVSIRVLSEKLLIVKSPDSGSGDVVEPRKLLTMVILEAAFCETASVLGLVLTFVAKNFYEMVPFLVISITGFAFYFPQKDRWQKCLRVDF